MPNNKWTKTATSASLAILGVTQLNNKADANIVQGGSNFSHTGNGMSPWALDYVPGYGAVARAGVYIMGNYGVTYFAWGKYDGGYAGFAKGVEGQVVNNGNAFEVFVGLGFRSVDDPALSGYFGFRDTKGSGAPIYGWAKWTTSANNTLTLNEWYYNSTPGASITVGDRGSSTDIPFDFNPLQGAALGVPIFIGLRQLKRRKAKLNTMVSVKGKEKMHPLALLGMGAAGVRKWREQKDKDAA